MLPNLLAHRIVLHVVPDPTSEHCRGPKVGGHVGRLAALEHHRGEHRRACTRKSVTTVVISSTFIVVTFLKKGQIAKISFSASALRSSELDHPS